MLLFIQSWKNLVTISASLWKNVLSYKMDCQKYIKEYNFYIVTNSGLGFARKPVDKKIVMHINKFENSTWMLKGSIVVKETQHIFPLT